ncbi:4-hydroxyphenylacetate 3-monooxygenase, oxygenase component [Neobacillus niacini]|uniref:4-hydroxyphenylacetate 3-monooxygenase, oxygenase component n=1 Tax=Neobacillus niacini TaxID=86668 RepID=UPI0021CB703E|nr:4-hydroxyphenylacetate 3-monooxygenase, oxygenase component [Neobacillus niacini]MCM3765673.1 4-hydroxyphenylacetate 3-monooxygenase, oxygenase component [Neobacillus niacini]
MGAINGKEFVGRIDQLNKEIWLDGKRIEGKLSMHPAFKGLIRTKASLYDLQDAPEYKDKLTYTSEETGAPIGVSFLQPKTKEDLKKRRGASEIWAKHTNGMMGRSPDYMNTVLMAFASSAFILEGKENCFPENIQSLYNRAKDNDLCFTHTFVSPQVNRSLINLQISKEPISARVVDKTEHGLIIKGARLLATQGGVTDEVLVYSAGGIIDEAEAFAFSIPSDTKGLKFICRESFVGGDSSYDHPLSSRFEEMDTILVFDRVLVPWERVFFYDNPEAANEFMLQSTFHHHATHQVITRQIVKTEFLLGLTDLLAKTINVYGYQQIQEKISEIIIGLESMRALLAKAENDAELDEWGTMVPSIIPLKVASNLFPKIYPRFVEIIQLIGASGMITLPTENDFSSPIKPDLDVYLQGTNLNAEERVQLFRLAWDMTMSPFGTRQTQYERYFFGDPVRMASHLYQSYPKDEFCDRISEFLNLSNEKSDQN